MKILSILYQQNQQISEEFQQRVHAGETGQHAVVHELQRKLGNRASNFKTAIVGNKVVDISANIDGKLVNFEVKSINSRPRSVVYDTIVYNSLKNYPNPILDTFIKSLTKGQAENFHQWIELARQTDQSIGFPGTPGVVNKTGKLPNPKTVTDSKVISYVRNKFIKRLRDQHISYFVLHHAPLAISKFYYTGYGENILQEKRTPKIVSIMIDTYGNPESRDKDMDDPTYSSPPRDNQIRVALKATFNF